MILLADSESPDQTARMRSLIRAFAVRLCPRARFRMARLDYLTHFHVYFLIWYHVQKCISDASKFRD